MRCGREVYVVGANPWRNPEDDLPAYFESTRDLHYEALRKPRETETFIAALKQRMTAALERYDTALTQGTTGRVRITRHRGEPWITVPKLGLPPKPPTLIAVQDEMDRRRATMDLLDAFKDADFLTEFTSVASRSDYCSVVSSGIQSGQAVGAGAVLLRPVGGQTLGSLLVRDQPQQVALLDQLHDPHSMAAEVADPVYLDDDDPSGAWVPRLPSGELVVVRVARERDVAAAMQSSDAGPAVDGGQHQTDAAVLV